MNIFLVVTFVWDMAYRGKQVTPIPPQPMPSIEMCQKVGEAMQELNNFQNGGYPIKFKCVVTP